jgi:hypothetical protein
MLEILAVLLALMLSLMLWQQWRYLRIRRDVAQDRQRLFHATDAFHVIVFFKLRSGTKVIDTARDYTQRILSGSRARLIYAGQAAFSAATQQLGEREWDGVLLFQYPSRAEYEESRGSPGYSDARQLFGDSYIHGMRRNRRASGSMPLDMLRTRLKNILTGKWRIAPLKESALFATAPELQAWRDRASRLRALHEVNRAGLVVYNLVKYSSGGHQDAVDSFGDEMLSRMAALGYGPLHIGRSVALEEFARYDRVFVVYYPSARYFADLLTSQYFPSFVGGKLLNDTLRVPTVPITERL